LEDIVKSYASKTALVTGASSGIGKAIAADLAKRGSNLILVARSEAALDELAAEARTSARVRADVVAMDLASEGAPQRLMEEIGQLGLDVDLLVNNAGFGRWGNFLDESIADYDEMMALNMRTVVDLCHLALPSMLARRDCAILNIGSTGSFVSLPWSAVYAATKAFVLSFSEALSYEVKDRGVQVTVLCPGETATGFAKIASRNLHDSGGASAESVARAGLDGLLKGECVIIPGGMANRQVAILPRFLPRATTLRIAGETWKKRMVSRGIPV
jgi:uncharacterized protein